MDKFESGEWCSYKIKYKIEDIVIVEWLSGPELGRITEIMNNKDVRVYSFKDCIESYVMTDFIRLASELERVLYG